MVRIQSVFLHNGVPRTVSLTATRFARSLPQFVVTGMSRSLAQDIRERLWSALRLAGIRIPSGRIVLACEPKIEGLCEGLDVPFLVAVLMLHGVIPESENLAAIGALSLDGSFCDYPGCVTAATHLLRESKNASTVLVPSPLAEIWRRCSSCDRFVSVASVADCVQKMKTGKRSRFISSDVEVQANTWWQERNEKMVFPTQASGSLLEALQILVAGGHHGLLFGNPGEGKTYATRFVDCLFPAWLPEDLLQFGVEEPRVYQFRGVLTPKRLERAAAGAAGGGLFLDELAEMPRNALELLKEPLDNYSQHFSSTILGAFNPCRCGKWGSAACRCLASEREQKMRHISGAMWDRFHLFYRVDASDVRSVSRKEWLKLQSEVTLARARMRERARNLGFPLWNRDLQADHLREFPALALEKMPRWNQFIKEWSWRRKLILQRVALTIADLAGVAPTEEHIFSAYAHCRLPQIGMSK